MDELAKALIELDGLAVTTSQDQEIEDIYKRLVDYDKTPILFKPQPQRPFRGRFGRKQQSGHMSVETMKRLHFKVVYLHRIYSKPIHIQMLSFCCITCHLTLKSRLVEAICICLCDRITQPTKSKLPSGRQIYISRWKAILSEYNIRVRLLNSHTLLEKTGLTLYHINESTLIRWYKNTSRVQEVRMLLQGLNLPSIPPAATDSLPTPHTRPTEPPLPPQDPHIFEDIPDTSGQARVRGAMTAASYSSCPGISLPSSTSSSLTPGSSISVPPPPSSSTVSGASTSTTPHSSAIGSEVDVETTSRVSRTTEWRHKKTERKNEQRKTYTCRICGQPMTSAGHTQFRGQRYCPNAPGQIPKEQWLAARKEEAKAKASAR